MNKNKFFVIGAVLTITMIAGSILVFATENTSNSLLSGAQKMTEDEIDNTISEVQDTNKVSVSEDNAISLALTYQSIISNDDGVSAISADNETNSVSTKLKENNLTDTSYWVVSTDSNEITLNAETGELMQLMSKQEVYEESTCDEDLAKEIAQNLYNNLDIDDNYKGYTLSHIEKFDEELWRVTFSSVYDGIYNDFQSVRLTFSPAEQTIKLLTIKDEEIENNEVILTEEEAINIAKDMINEDSEPSCTLQFVRLNYFFEDTEAYLEYKKSDIIRKAWVVQFNNENQTFVYVDATTGEVIGGDIVQ